MKENIDLAKRRGELQTQGENLFDYMQKRYTEKISGIVIFVREINSEENLILLKIKYPSEKTNVNCIEISAKNLSHKEKKTEEQIESTGSVILSFGQKSYQCTTYGLFNKEENVFVSIMILNHLFKKGVFEIIKKAEENMISFPKHFFEEGHYLNISEKMFK